MPSHRHLLPCFLALLVSMVLALASLPLAAMADPNYSAPSQDDQLSAPQGVRPITPALRTAELSLQKMTAVITDSSGWEADVTVKNTSSVTLPAGTLSASISPSTIQAATDAQNWADGQNILGTPLPLAEQSVPRLRAGASRTIHLSADKNNQSLQAIRSWGAKPVLLAYAAGPSGTVATVQTFATRSHAGLHLHENPPITLTFALPFVSNDWQTSPTALTRLITSSRASAQISSLPDQQIARLRQVAGIVVAHPFVQTVIDPATFALVEESTSAATSSAKPHSSHSGRSKGSSSSKASAKSGKSTTSTNTGTADGKTGNTQTRSGSTTRHSTSIAPVLPASHLTARMQPYLFDIPASRAFQDKRWREAGITSNEWSAQAANPLSDTVSPQESLQPIAWENVEPWDSASLATAVKQGYSTVISESALPSVRGANQHTGRIVIATTNGNATVLIAQHELSSLASGSHTSTRAQAENTDAGRLARFAAESSIYEAEQPYIARNLLVSFGRAAKPTLMQKIANLLPSCDWIRTGTLGNLEAGKTGTDLDKTGHENVDSSAFILNAAEEEATAGNGAASNRARTSPATRRASIGKALAILASTRSSINRVGSSILDPSALKEQTDKGNTDNPQNLAKQNAQQAAENRVTAHEWLDKLRQAHHQLALTAIANRSPATSPEVKTARDFAHRLLTAVRLMPPDHVNIFSQSARMPVTVRNSLPFAVRVRVAAETNLIATSITPSQKVHAMANAETQANFTITSIGWSQTQASFRLVDNKGKFFGTTKSAMIYSQLSLGDTSGYALIALAVVLGIVGLWRQFHVKKDPNQ